MKILRYISAAAAAVALLSCTGNVDESSRPVLEVSDTEIDLASETQATFTVTYNAVDVTAGSEIISTAEASELVGNVFTPTAPGTWSFHAVYNGMESEAVTVNVIDTEVKVESKYDRHVFVAEFTGASCAFCPAGYDNMTLQLSKPSMAKYKPYVHIAAFHSTEMGTDTLAIDETNEIKAMFDGLDLPSYAVDLRDSGGLNTDGISGFNAALKTSFEESATHCGVAVSSEISGETAQVEVRVTSELTSEYRVVVLIVQDGITGYQKHGTYGELDDYNHMHVVRQVVTANAGQGEKLTDDSRIAAGQEAAKTWTVGLSRNWVPEDTKVYALALDKDGHVNNMNVCALDGGDSDYDLK